MYLWWIILYFYNHEYITNEEDFFKSRHKKIEQDLQQKFCLAVPEMLKAFEVSMNSVNNVQDWKDEYSNYYKTPQTCIWCSIDLKMQNALIIFHCLIITFWPGRHYHGVIHVLVHNPINTGGQQFHWTCRDEAEF